VQTQKDHVEAYSFLMGRMTSALVAGEASYQEAPARRARNGLVIGAVLALMIAIGFFVFGLIVHFSKPQAQSPAPAPSQRTAPVQGTAPSPGTAPQPRSRPVAAQHGPRLDVSRVLLSVRTGG